MSGRLAGYAAEIERYLRGAAGVKREDLDDNKSLTGGPTRGERIPGDEEL